MLGPSHRVFGALCGAAVATVQGADFQTVAMTAIVATATAHGWSSPDMDQTKPWQAVGRALPGPLGALMAHRRLSHWVGLPAAAWWGITQMPAGSQWPFTALLIGWVSHLLGDMIFGAVPLLPWGAWPVGLRLDTGGVLETGRTKHGRRVLPFAPARVLIGAGLIWLLAAPLLSTYQMA